MVSWLSFSFLSTYKSEFSLGVASHEGRILVMTTNHPQKLDEALVRPGRVDFQVTFARCNRYQTKEIFKRMYSESANFSDNVTTEGIPECKELDALAQSFADHIENDMFSPADIQGFLLKRKEDARKAAKEIEEWAREKRVERAVSGSS